MKKLEPDDDDSTSEVDRLSFPHRPAQKSFTLPASLLRLHRSAQKIGCFSRQTNSDEIEREREMVTYGGEAEMHRSDEDLIYGGEQDVVVPTRETRRVAGE
uniref:Uncharacterized protein n=1 Tax=Nymphaea colorata TaxID=210225 RepID=A0A5K0YKW8_9MAGN|nr:unnamed protein product [Nymphaea colorata]